MQVTSNIAAFERPSFKNSEQPVARDLAAGVENGSEPRAAAPLKRVEPVVRTENAEVAKSNDAEPVRDPQSPAERAAPKEERPETTVNYDRFGQGRPSADSAVGVNFDQAA